MLSPAVLLGTYTFGFYDVTLVSFLEIAILYFIIIKWVYYLSLSVNVLRVYYTSQIHWHHCKQIQIKWQNMSNVWQTKQKQFDAT